MMRVENMVKLKEIKGYYFGKTKDDRFALTLAYVGVLVETIIFSLKLR